MTFAPLSPTSVGSFPRPGWLAETNRSRAKFRLEGEALREAQDDATALCLREQEELGLELLTDGEQRRESFVYHAASTWDGVDMARKGNKETYRGRVNPHTVPRIVGPVRRRSPAVVDDLRFARAHTRLPLKMAVAGPMTMIDSTLNEAYDDESHLAMDIAAAVNAELRELQAAGCDVLQIDEPAMTRYHQKVFDYGARALDRCLDGITVPTLVHLCYGYPGGDRQQHEYTYPDLLDSLMTTRISGFTVEFGRSDYDPKLLAACGDRLIMFGCIDPGNTPAPTADEVKRRIAGLLDHVDPSRVLLGPDCGLMTISRELATEKLRAMIAAARALRAEL
ncbi:MAG: uroporphyrinogen decarboxylase family protein [Alphaproteobacteria bacterium]